MIPYDSNQSLAAHRARIQKCPEIFDQITQLGHNTMVIGLSGPENVGKSTSATLLLKMTQDWIRLNAAHWCVAAEVPLAKSMKDMVHQLFGVPYEHLFGDSELRNSPLNFRFPARPEITTVRDLLAYIGFEWGRGLDEDLWNKLWCRNMAPISATVRARVYFVSDPRFDNDVAHISLWPSSVLLHSWFATDGATPSVRGTYLHGSALTYMAAYDKLATYCRPGIADEAESRKVLHDALVGVFERNIVPGLKQLTGVA